MTYTFTKFPVDIGRLEQEILASEIIIALEGITLYGEDQLSVTFKGALPSDSLAILDAIVTNHTGEPLPVANSVVDLDTARSNTGAFIFETGITTGKIGSRGMSLVTPDLSDRTTWYQKSVQVVDETLTDSGDGLTFTSAHAHWININSLKLTYTHKQIPKRDGTFGRHSDWAIAVKVNGTAVTSGFTINYAAGTVVFNSSQSGNTVICTYWHNDGVVHPSEWLLTPGTGKKYIVEHAELQMSCGLVANDTLRFEIWAGAGLGTYGSFPDYLFEAGYGQMRADYRGAHDIINAANLGQGSIPIFGGLTKEVIVIPFSYLQAFTLDSAVGAVFRVVLVNDLPYSAADIATGTFYLQVS